MRAIFIVVALFTLAGCSSNKMYYSPFDLNRDGTLASDQVESNEFSDWFASH
jgi:hypothetical protein